MYIQAELVVQHGGYPAAAKARGEAQSCGAHGEVGYKVPNQSNKLDDRRDEREEGALELRREKRVSVGSKVGMIQ